MSEVKMIISYMHNSVTLLLTARMKGMLKTKSLTVQQLVLCIVSFINCLECIEKVKFYATDIRRSQFGKAVTTGYCLLPEECAIRCLMNDGCRSVRLFPLVQGFLSEYIMEERGQDNYRMYFDINGIER